YIKNKTAVLSDPAAAAPFLASASPSTPAAPFQQLALALVAGTAPRAAAAAMMAPPSAGPVIGSVPSFSAASAFWAKVPATSPSHSPLFNAIGSDGPGLANDELAKLLAAAAHPVPSPADIDAAFAIAGTAPDL